MNSKKKNGEVFLMLDSGAPSFYNKLVRQGKGTHTGSYFGDRMHDDFSFVGTDSYDKYFRDYIDFIKKYLSYLDVCVNFDVINNPEETYRNQKIMEKEGLKPIPVFHCGSDTRWLKKYLEEGYEYISIGGIFPNPKSVTIPLLDYIWSEFLTDKNGLPAVKVHGLAMTSFDMMKRYPWYSVDSTSWVITGRYGCVYVPKRKGGKYVYNDNSRKVFVSTQSPSKESDGKHIDTFSNMERKEILEYFDSKGFKMGKTEKRLNSPVSEGYKLSSEEEWLDKKKRVVGVKTEIGLCNDYRLRDELNILYFLDLEKSIPKYPWPFNMKKKRKKGFV